MRDFERQDFSGMLRRIVESAKKTATPAATVPPENDPEADEIGGFTASKDATLGASDVATAESDLDSMITEFETAWNGMKKILTEKMTAVNAEFKKYGQLMRKSVTQQPEVDDDQARAALRGADGELGTADQERINRAAEAEREGKKTGYNVGRSGDNAGKRTSIKSVSGDDILHGIEGDDETLKGTKTSGADVELSRRKKNAATLRALAGRGKLKRKKPEAGGTSGDATEVEFGDEE